MTAIMIGLLCVSVGAAFSVGFGAMIAGDVLMGFGLFSGIRGLFVVFKETLRADGAPGLPFALAPTPRPAMRPAPLFNPRPPHAAVARGLPLSRRA